MTAKKIDATEVLCLPERDTESDKLNSLQTARASGITGNSLVCPY